MAAAEIEITVRVPDFDPAATPHVWMPGNPDLGYRLNGGSLTLPYLEPYLIRVMRQARTEIERRLPERSDLLRDIDLFNAQEANHFKLHRRYNALLRERYDGITEIEAEIEADFARMLREESLEWNLGYSAGFETTGMAMAQLYFGEARAGLAGVDPAVHRLWGWHLAEEYEHRCVAFDVFRALGGSWRRRVELFFFQARHLNGFGARAAALMRAQDEAAGRLHVMPEDAATQRRLGRRMARATLWRTLRALLPSHDPRRHAPLTAADDFLAALATA